MNKSEIKMWKDAFLAAADRAVSAGFDLIELHSAHGYGLNQWLSPITNQRKNEDGNDSFGRMRLLLEIVCDIRLLHPKLLISVRLPGQDFYQGGLTIDDTILVSKSLEKAGVDIIHVSSGIGGWQRSSSRIGEGYLVDEAARIQAEVDIPVIGVGGIHSGNYIDLGISSKKFSLAAVGRAILENPREWGQNNLLKKKENNMEINQQKINETIQNYVTGYLNAEKDLIEKTFHSETKLYSVDEDKLDQLGMKEWINNLDQRKSRGEIRKATLKIKSIDITDNAAVAKILLTFEKFQSTDYLSLLNIKGDWIIVGKIYSVK